MEKFIETTGENRDAAIAAALAQLGMDRDDVSVEVLDNGKKGFLGIGATPARVRVTYEVPDEPVKAEPVHTPVEKIEKAEKPAKPRHADKPTAPKAEKAPKADKPKPQKLSITDEDDTPRLVKAAPADFVPEKLEIERPPRRERPRRERGGRGRRAHEERPVTPSVPKERELIPVSEEGMKKAEQLATDFITGLL